MTSWAISSSVCLPTRAARIKPLDSARLLPIERSATSRSWAQHCFCFLRQMTTVHLHSPPRSQLLSLFLVNQLGFRTCSTGLAHDGVVSKPCAATDPTQATSLTVRLQHLTNLLRFDLCFDSTNYRSRGEGLSANRTEIALMSVGHQAVFMGFGMATQRALHGRVADESSALFYQSHVRLTHYRSILIARLQSLTAFS